VRFVIPVILDAESPVAVALVGSAGVLGSSYESTRPTV